MREHKKVATTIREADFMLSGSLSKWGRGLRGAFGLRACLLRFSLMYQIAGQSLCEALRARRTETGPLFFVHYQTLRLLLHISFPECLGANCLATDAVTRPYHSHVQDSSIFGNYDPKRARMKSTVNVSSLSTKRPRILLLPLPFKATSSSEVFDVYRRYAEERL